VQEQALKQNITTLHNRVNELGVAEPVIQQQGWTASWCSCPACRTPPRPRTSWAAPPRWKCAWSTKAPKRARRVRHGPGAVRLRALSGARRPPRDRQEAGDPDRRQPDRCPARLRRQTQEPKVNLTVWTPRAGASCATPRARTWKRMAILLFEKGKGEVLTAPVIRTEIGGAGCRSRARHDRERSQRHWPCCCAPARWRRPWRSSKSAPLARAWVPRTSPRALTV
jgi:preprotein translocase subunit SecD